LPNISVSKGRPGFSVNYHQGAKTGDGNVPTTPTYDALTGTGAAVDAGVLAAVVIDALSFATRMIAFRVRSWALRLLNRLAT
jgi:hypothetical protein